VRRPLPLLALVLTLAWLTAPLAAHAVSFSGIVAFGDSLTDTGNLGRFSNGQIWVEDLSSSLGLGAVSPSNSGGSDYAVGGATTSDLAGQIAGFQSDVSGVADPNALYIVWAGGNDVLGTLAGVSSITMSDAAQNVANAITSLAVMGAHDFLVPNLPDLGLTPAVLGAGSTAVAAAHSLSVAFNAALAADLAGLTGVNIVQLDVYASLNSVVADPAAYGFTDVTDPCSTSMSTCATPDTYLFWDGVHPTATGHALLAAGALVALPEPGSLALLLLGGAVLAVRRRRRILAA
jgi:phospholipase/lecithinase/hemolysin